MNKKLLKVYKDIETITESKVISYVTGDRNQMGTQIGKDVIELFGDHLESIGKCKKITLILYTLGGDTMAAWNIINLIKEYCEELDIIVPRKARSSGTIMCLGAKNIIMTKQSTLGPIDPSLTSALGPKVNVGNNQVVNWPTSVESVKGYFDFAKKELKINNQKELIKAFIKITENIHPLLLGDVYRVKSQIKMIAKKLLNNNGNVRKRCIEKRIINFLTTDSGSHDYSIGYAEAKKLGLDVKLADEKLNSLINDWYNIINDEMKLRMPYDPVVELAEKTEISYKYIRAILDSIDYGRNQFVSQGVLTKIVQPIGVPNQAINDTRIFEGWEKDVEK